MKALLLLACLLTTPVDGPEYYELRSGHYLRAEVVQVDGERVRLRVPISGGHYLAWKRLDDFMPHSVYRILRSQVGDADPQGHIDLARFATEHDLVYVAQRELRRAREIAGDDGLSPELEAEMSERGAIVLERLFRGKLENGRLSDARRHLSELLIRYPDSEVAARKDELLAEYDAGELRLKEERHRAREAIEDERAVRQRESRLEPLRKRLAAGKHSNRQGLLRSKSFSTANRLFLEAAGWFERVARDAEKLIARYDGDQLLVEEAGALRESALSELQDALLNAASASLVRGSINNALGHVNKVLALNPKSGAAHALRARIEIAANQYGYGYGYGYRN